MVNPTQFRDYLNVTTGNNEAEKEERLAEHQEQEKQLAEKEKLPLLKLKWYLSPSSDIDPDQTCDSVDAWACCFPIMLYGRFKSQTHKRELYSIYQERAYLRPESLGQQIQDLEKLKKDLEETIKQEKESLSSTAKERYWYPVEVRNNMKEKIREAQYGLWKVNLKIKALEEIVIRKPVT